MKSDIASHPLLDNYGIVADDWYACAGWVRPGASPALKQPVTSPIPTLVLQGTFDPITPVEVGKAVAQRLDHAVYVEFPQVGHKIVDQSVCGQKIAAAFLDAPTTAPSRACLDGEPERPSNGG
jgi:pimeloyl-ACP methyl ester carboxylesterase